MQFHIARALEFLEDDLIHAAARLHQRRGDDRQAAAVFDGFLAAPKNILGL